MKNNKPPPRLQLVKVSAPEQSLVCDALARLEEGRAMLAGAGQAETVRLLDIVLLQMRAELHGISRVELQAVCDALTGPAIADDQLRGARPI